MRKILTAATIAALSTSAGAVDLMGVYELAVSNDPQIRAAERRLDASEIETKLARANFLPEINATLQRTPIGNSQPKIAGVDLDENDIDSENYSVNLTQSLYDHGNFARMERARGWSWRRPIRSSTSPGRISSSARRSVISTCSMRSTACASRKRKKRR